MYVGIANPNAIVPLKKMVIVNEDKKEKITVLYNPQSYRHERTVKYSDKAPVGSEGPVVQFLHGDQETLSFELFFDSMYAGAEAGDIVDGAKFAGNSLLPSAGNAIDIRTYTNKVYTLSLIEKKVHRPPLLTVEWGKLRFKGYLISCKQEFTKFNETGKAVRARMDCTFLRSLDEKEQAGAGPPESPDTTKYRRLKEGDSLWAMASAEYGDSGRWRPIADANGISNPRLLHRGDMIRIPALKD